MSPPPPQGWAALLPELLFQIACRLLDVADFACFRCVCRSWRSAVRPSDLPPQPPWLILRQDPDDDGGGGGPGRPCHGDASGSAAPRSLLLPEVGRGRFVVGSDHGWLALADNSSFFRLTLLNPFTGVCFILPSTSAIHGKHFYRAALSAPPASPSGSTVVVLTLDLSAVYFCSRSAAGADGGAGGGDWSPWGRVDIAYSSCVYDMGFFRGQLYLVDDDELFGVVDLDGPSPTATCVRSLRLPAHEKGWILERAYFAASTDEQLLLAAFYGLLEEDEGEDEDGAGAGEESNSVFPRDAAKVYRMEEIGGEPRWKEVRSLDGQALFLSNISTVAVKAGGEGGLSGVKENCLYLANCLLREQVHGTIRTRLSKDVHVFDMGDGRVDQLPFKWGYLPKLYTERAWVIPSLT